MTHRIKHQHPAEEVDSFMGCLARQCVQNRKRWLQTKQTSQHHSPLFLSASCIPYRYVYQIVYSHLLHFLKMCHET